MSYEAPAEVIDGAYQQARNGEALQRLVKIMERLRDPELADSEGELGRRCIEEHYRLEDQLARFTPLYEAVLARRSEPSRG